MYAWLEARALRTESERLDEDKDLETALLGRRDPLIDLGLARFGLCSGVLGELFARSTDAREAIRIAALSNTAVANVAHSGLPAPLMSDEELPGWIARFSRDDIKALFGNPKIDGAFLAYFLQQNDVWAALDEDRQQHALLALSANPRIKEDDNASTGRWAEYRHGCGVLFGPVWTTPGRISSWPRSRRR